MTLRKVLGMLMLVVSGVVMGQSLVGKIGLTTTSSQTNVLRINNITTTRPFLITGYQPAIRFGDTNNDAEDDAVIGLASDVGGLGITSSISGDLIMRNLNSTGSLLFGTYVSSGVASERMRIATNGNIGIGITNPLAKLSLGSDVNNTKFAISDNGNSTTPVVYGIGYQPLYSSGQLRFHLGGVSGDVFSFLNSPAGTELFRINADGKIGINAYGTSTTDIAPHTAFHVKGGVKEANANGNTFIRVQNMSGGLYAKAGIEFTTYSATGASTRIEAVDLLNCRAALAFSTIHPGTCDISGGPVERMRINSDGNVGIGDFSPGAAPSSHLTIKKANPVLSLENTNSLPTPVINTINMGSNYSIVMRQVSSCGASYFGLGDFTGSNKKIYITNTNKIVFGSTNNLADGCSGSPAFTGEYIFDGQASAKTLLVATPAATPNIPAIPSGYIFHVQGNSQLKGSLMVTTNSSPAANSVEIIDQLSSGIIRTNGSKPLELNPAGTNYVAIGYNTATSLGTTLSSDYKLRVKGKIICEELKVQLSSTNWPDYVFEKDYKLASLDSVETFINENKHLPEVPSAKEVEANGIEAGQMNAILLKKVEELTLYMIQQQKEIEALKIKNAQIEEQLGK